MTQSPVGMSVLSPCQMWSRFRCENLYLLYIPPVSVFRAIPDPSAKKKKEELCTLTSKPLENLDTWIPQDDCACVLPDVVHSREQTGQKLQRSAAIVSCCLNYRVTVIVPEFCVFSAVSHLLPFGSLLQFRPRSRSLWLLRKMLFCGS